MPDHDPILDPIARIESAARELSALMPESREPAKILASVAALRRLATPRKDLPEGWRWLLIHGETNLTRMPNEDACHIAGVIGNQWIVFEAELSATRAASGFGVDHEDARLAAEDYLWANGWPT